MTISVLNIKGERGLQGNPGKDGLPLTDKDSNLLKGMVDRHILVNEPNHSYFTKNATFKDGYKKKPGQPKFHDFGGGMISTSEAEGKILEIYLNEGIKKWGYNNGVGLGFEKNKK